MSKPEQSSDFDPDESAWDHVPEFDWMRYYLLLRRRLWLILLVAGVVILGAFGWLLRQPKVYASRAVLQVEQQERQVLKMEEIQSEKLDSLEFMNTVVQAMTNSNLMARVVNRLELAKDPVFAPPKLDGGTYTEAELASKLQNMIRASIRRGTRLIDVVAEAEDPEQARLLAETVAKEFLRQGFDQRLAISKVTNEFLEEETEKLKKKLAESERKSQEYKERYNAVSLEQSQNIIVDKLKELSTQVTQAKSARLRLESDLEHVRKIPASDVESLLQVGSVIAIPQVASIREQLVKAETDLSALQKRYLYKHPKQIAAVTQIDHLKASLHETLQGASNILERQYESAKDTELKLTQALEEQEKSALALNKIAIPYNVLARDVETDRAMYDAVITRLRETTITLGIEKSPFRVIEEPMAARFPSKPEKSRVMTLAIVLGFAAGVFVVLGFDYIDSSLHSVDQTEGLLGLSALTAIPEEKSKDVPIAIIDAPSSSQAEAFRTLRTSLSLIGEEEKRRILLFTSAIPAEGKSFVSINTAAAFAQQGLKTLLIDADLRRPRLGERLLGGNSAKLPGLTNYLSELTSLEGSIQKTSLESLSLMPAGQRAPNPAELLASKKFEALLATALQTFDRIIIDTAPINAVSDTLLLAKYAHAVCLVVRSNKTPAKAVQRAALLLRKANARMAGFVLNRLPAGSGAGYYYYYYGDEYAKDGVYGAAKKAA